MECNPEYKALYHAGIKEYFDQDQAELVPEEELNNGDVFYLPHHYVLKDSSTTKLRVVFDASCSSNNGKSLNDCLMVGPKLQPDLLDILIRFRCHKVAFIADIQKMYSQVKLNYEDRDYHRFLWREDSQDVVFDYRMKVVTFGVNSSAHHAQ